MAFTLNDQGLLSTDPTFIQRVRTGMIATAIAISNEGPVALHAGRDQIAVQALSDPDRSKLTFASAVATDTTVTNLATANGTVVLTVGNLATQAALVTDAAINNALSAMWNSFFQH